MMYAKMVVNEAFDNDLVEGGTLKPFRNVEKLLKKDANKREVKEAEVMEKAERIFEHSPPHLQWIMGIMAFTGMRPKSEILNLRWSQIDYEKGFIHLSGEDTKNGKPRDIPICEDLSPFLKSIPRAIHDDHVILYKGKPIGRYYASLSKACEKAGVIYGRFKEGGFILYDLRKAFRTYLRKRGVHDTVAMEITGHSSQEMLNRYNTVDEEDKRDAITHLNGHFGNIRQNVRQNEEVLH